MNAVIRSSLDGSDVKVKQVPIPKVSPGHVLIKVLASPINPSDQYFMLNGYGIKEKIKAPPVGIGFEGAGIITEIGEGVEPHYLNMKVGFASDPHSSEFQGAWSQYVTKPAIIPVILPFSSDIDPIQGASYFVNPFTVVGMYDVAKKSGNTAIVHNVGASSLGKMLIKFGQKMGFETINIVRRQEQADLIQKEFGAKYVINTGKEGWEKEFKEITHKLNAKIIFDAIAGDLAGIFLQQMPYGSTLYNYGGLSGKALGNIAISDCIFYDKTVKGFWLGVWLKSLKPLEAKAYGQLITNDINTGGKIFGSKVGKTFKLEEFKEAVEYARSNASEAKAYILPNPS